MEVAVLIFDGFDELDAIGPYEVLANAAQLGADLRVQLLTLRPADEVTGTIDLALWLVEREWGAELAKRSRRRWSTSGATACTARKDQE